jgi:hypothetical protein
MYLAQDIDSMREDFDLRHRGLMLNKEGLDLQNDKLAHNDKWSVINMLIGVGSSLSKPIIQDIENKARQQEIRKEKEINDAAIKETELGILNGDITVKINPETGKYEYSGLSKSVNDIFSNASEEVNRDMGGLKTGNAGRVNKNLEDMKSSLDVAALKMIIDRSKKEADAEYQTNLKIGTEMAVRGDSSLLNSTFAAREEIDPDGVKQDRYNAGIKVRNLQITNKGIELAINDGLSSASKYIDEQEDWDAIQKDEVRSQVEQTYLNAKNAAVSSVPNRMAELTLEKRPFSEIKAIMKAETPLGIQDAVDKEILQNQKIKLVNQFAEETAGSNTWDLSKWNNERMLIESRKSDYEGNMPLYNTQLDVIDKNIDAIKEAEANQAEKAKKDGLLNVDEKIINDYVDRYYNGEINTKDAIRGINSVDNLTDKTRKLITAGISRIIGKDNPLAADAYRLYDESAAYYLANLKKQGKDTTDFLHERQRVEKAIQQEIFNGTKGEDLEKLIKDYIKVLNEPVIYEILKTGFIGKSSLSNTNAIESGAAEFLLAAENGGLDIIFGSYTSIIPTGKDVIFETSNNTIIENADVAKQKTAEAGLKWANKELTNRGLILEKINYTVDENNDPDGTFTYEGSDGETYRVKATKDKTVFLERLGENGTWKKVNIDAMSDMFQLNIKETTPEEEKKEINDIIKKLKEGKNPISGERFDYKTSPPPGISGSEWDKRRPEYASVNGPVSSYKKDNKIYEMLHAWTNYFIREQKKNK